MKDFLFGIKNIIFDLGEVITDVHFKHTFEAFDTLAGKDTQSLYNFHKQNKVFDDLETGKISPAEFRNLLRELFSINHSDAEIDAAWNAMIGETPLQKLQFVSALRPKFKTFILSNTNQIHIDCVNLSLQKSYQIESLHPFFDAVYFSHEIGVKKPDAEAYLYILDKHNLKASETVFIDDKEENIQAAEKLGIKTYWLTNKEDLYELLK